MRGPYKYTREVLEPIVAESISVADVVRELGLRPNGGAHSHLCRVIKKHQPQGTPPASGCGNDGTWMGVSLTLEVDHVDGDLFNNSPSNLRFLCPNCHRQTPNFAGRSRGRYTQPPLDLDA